jgi:chromate transporter
MRPTSFAVVPPVSPRASAGELAKLAWAFLRLGSSSFGGPVAHIGYLRAEFVVRRKWLNDPQFGDLVALCQFLPGPASSQLVFALGLQRAGLLGALAASVCFTLPSALLMIGFAYGMANIGNMQQAGWLHGLKLAAVPVVAQAVWGMAKQLCTDRTRVALCLVAAGLLLVAPGAYMQFAAIACSAFIGWRCCRDTAADQINLVPEFTPRSRVLAGAALMLFGVLLVLLPVLAATTGNKQLAVFASFYRSGALVFGGGHVVMPLLRAEIVPRGWLSHDQFIAGYGAAQALPGPLFAFSAYLGTVMDQGAGAWRTGLCALLAIYLPSWLLVGGVLPFWQRLRTHQWAQAALAGANAAVVGVLLAALYSPLISESVHGSRDAAAALLAFGALEHVKLPPWLVVLALAGAGQWLL